MSTKYPAITKDHVRIARAVLAANPGYRSAWNHGRDFADFDNTPTVIGIATRRAEIARLTEEGLLAKAIAPLVGLNERQVTRIRKSLKEAA